MSGSRSDSPDSALWLEMMEALPIPAHYTKEQVIETYSKRIAIVESNLISNGEATNAMHRATRRDEAIYILKTLNNIFKLVDNANEDMKLRNKFAGTVDLAKKTLVPNKSSIPDLSLDFVSENVSSIEMITQFHGKHIESAVANLNRALMEKRPGVANRIARRKLSRAILEHLETMTVLMDEDMKRDTQKRFSAAESLAFKTLLEENITGMEKAWAHDFSHRERYM